jgi:hypothetical protein
MTQIETLKAQAQNLKHAMSKMGMEISLAQALEAVAQQYGLDNWDTFAGILNKVDASEALSVQLVIPQMVKSAKGCQLLILCSHDGANYDRHLIVPPHLDVTVIANKMEAEILRLKEIDAALEEAENYEGEYTEVDLARYAGSIGCLWVGKPTVVRENWD